jgi:hypothetical protein
MARGSTIALWKSGQELETVAMLEGREVGRVTYAVSAGGRTLTVAADGAAHRGYPGSQHRVVFTRQ